MDKRLKRFLRTIYYFPSTSINKLIFIFHKVKYDRGLEIMGVIYVKNKGNITVSRNVRINSSAKSNPIGTGNKTYFQILPQGKLTIGNNTRISNSAITCAESVFIGRYVRIGSGCKIYDTDFHSLNPYKRTAQPEIADAKHRPIIIEDYAFIGTDSFILKGVTIGKCSVVGAGSVVTNNIPEGEIWAGNPAVFIRKLTKEEMQNQ